MNLDQLILELEDMRDLLGDVRVFLAVHPEEDKLCPADSVEGIADYQLGAAGEYVVIRSISPLLREAWEDMESANKQHPHRPHHDG